MPIPAGCELSLYDNCECFGLAYNYVGKKLSVTVLWDYQKVYFFFSFFSFRFFTYIYIYIYIYFFHGVSLT